MKKKRILAALLSCAMISAALIGCSGDGSSSSAAGGKTSENQLSTDAGAGGEKVKLTAIFVKHSLTKDLNAMQWLADLEEKCGVEVEWQQISADWDRKKPAMFASGEIPDLLINATADSDYVQYNGLFEDMKPLIEQYAPNLQKMFKELPETETMVTTMEGKIFGTPKYQSVWPNTNGTMYINKKWLDAVDLDVPTTWDELEEALLAFKENDVNGNGDPDDEIPMDFNGGFCGPYSLMHLLGSTGMQITGPTPTGGYFAEDGQVKNYYVDERFKRTVKFVQRLWDQGLINEEALTQDYSKYQSLTRSDGETSKVGFTWGWEKTQRVGVNLAEEYVSIPQLKENEDTEKVCYSYDFYGLNYAGNRAAMSAKCQNKEAAMKFIDGFYDEKVSLEVLFGGMNDADMCVKDNGDGSYEVLAPADANLDPSSWKWTNTFADNGPMWIRDGMKIALGADMQAVTEEKSVYDGLFEDLDPKDIYPDMFMKYSEQDTNTMAMNQANIDNIVEPAWSSWVTDPSKDVDAEWDAYVQNVMNAGLTQNLEIRQKAFGEYLKTMA